MSDVLYWWTVSGQQGCSYVRHTDNIMCSSVQGWKVWASLDRIQKKNPSYFAPMGITPLEPTPTGMWSNRDCKKERTK